MRLRIVLAAAALLTAAFAAPATAAPAGGVNDPACRPSAAHPRPVVFLHGLGATSDEDLNLLQDHVAAKGYCTFSRTYGAYPQFPVVGGLRPIADSATEIKQFIGEVLAETGAAQVDLVGHSEGGFQTLYVTKTQGIADRVGSVVAIAPPTHGTTFANLTKLAYLLGIRDEVGKVLTTFGCPACDNLITDGSAVQTLTNGPIAQPGVRYTVLTSRFDELVTPTETSFVREPGVTNEYVQDTCPFDPVGHIGEAYDRNVWNLVTNALDPAHATKFLCAAGSPG
ncbi:alpha/beta fold hydrolase [Amycolatopsis rubida]|uniref:Alpha/beta fold hydrolase n=1 Tax=Amycolatopsis rubida TaxID=112413 RepID=A0A1I5WS78_9PSEU|nr:MULTISPECIES: alpha/beta fold hydrolase [Amycolatopsis]MYW97693.1 alpha/beta fold hydrolase [Amycolatopsis rubida]NEC62679.1 alpha/beta fold hydrolase [Amycolatopsis rubida]OAP28477.1 Lipase EstA precursor [Amycolatopsis sp. M39]SFQ22378.1 Triacylglycerol esterase/lipase EstA, alpha/beta hydrolase fold [Amycolatopsis rubida]